MNVLAVFAHPDDEVLGCGGTLAKHAENGDDVRVDLFVSRGLQAAAIEAQSVLGVQSHSWASYPDQRLDTFPLAELADTLTGICDPDVIYTHHPGDLNMDHSLTARAVLTAFRPKPGEKPRTILACEVLSSTERTFPQEFSPNWFESLDGPHLDKKIAAMECYPTEVTPPRDGPGITTLASYRGNQCGTAYAEAFQLLRRGPM